MRRIVIISVIVAVGYLVVQTGKRSSFQKQILTAVSICYGAGFIYFTFLSRAPGDSRINTVLFYTIYRSLKYPVHIEIILPSLLSGQWELIFTTLKPIENAILNIFLFIPFGFLLPEWKRGISSVNVLQTGFMLSGMIEVVQRLTGLGWFDVDDLLCNLIGTALGVLLFKAGSWAGRRNRI